MPSVPIRQVPKQGFSIILEETLYDIELAEISGLTYATIKIDSDVKVSNHICCINQPIIPFDYLHVGAGNFMFTSVDESYPSYENYNISTFLRYINIAGDIL